MLHVSLDPFRLTIRESVGLIHETQVVEIPVPESSPALFHLRDESTGRLYPVQSSHQKPGYGYLLLSIEPDQVLSLVPFESAPAIELNGAVSVEENADAWLVQNDKFALELSSGQQRFLGGGELALGPVRRLRESNGPWRGRTFFDTARRALREEATWKEKGPLRSVYHYRIEFEQGGFYELDLTFDAVIDFARFHETFQGAASDQIVWDFSGADLPERISLLDSNPGYAPKWLHYHLDQRHARLFCWTQCSQLHDLSDGYSLHFTGTDDALGLVSIEGGKWDGNALNHIEAWSRRWQSSDPTTRRLPADTKADSFPGTDAIPARGHSVNQPHFTWEGWLRRGSRRFALVISTNARLAPPIDLEGPIADQDRPAIPTHFEHVPNRDLYRRLQSRLRKIHAQHGMFPLQDQLGLTFHWPVETSFTPEGNPPADSQRHACEVGHATHVVARTEDPDLIEYIDAFLAARIYGYWEGAGAVYANCVVSRRVGPDMMHFEALAQAGKLSPERIARWRAWFAFMANLYHTDNHYPGASTMEPLDSDNSVEPTIAGMANQNFYTDVITLPAFAAQVFSGHPSVAAWREKFLVDWKRQLEYHMFPKSGVWEESHTYYQHVLFTVLPLFLRTKADGGDDGFADPAFQKLVASAIPQITPRNTVTGGMRHIVPFGDHGSEPEKYRLAYRELALGFAPHAPVLAGNLAWVSREMDGGEIPGVPALAPELVTGYQEGLGFFFRSHDAAGGESLLALRTGMAWGHHHHDDGSFQFYAHGRAMIADSACSQPQERGERKVQGAGHSRVVVEGVEPLNFLWRFSRGWVLDSRTEGDLAYAAIGTPTFATMPKGLTASPLRQTFWELRVVVELAPAVYLIADYLDVSQTHVARFHIPQGTVASEENRIVATFGPDSRLEIAPLFTVAAPALSIDRPVNPAKVPQENTTSVEYRLTTGPWSLFVVAALNAKSALRTNLEPEAIQLEVGGKRLTILHEIDHRLKISTENPENQVTIDAQALLAQLRAGSR